MAVSREASGVRLRPARADDEVALSAIRNDPVLQELLLAHPTPHTMEEVRAWIRRRESAPSAYFAVIADAGTDLCKGFLQLTNISIVDGFAQLGLCVGEAFRGTGVGRAALRAAEDVCRDRGLGKIIVYVRSDNIVARKLYEAIAYREVGVLRDHFRAGGRRHDVVLLEKFLVA